jgi:hypothetical protein
MFINFFKYFLSIFLINFFIQVICIDINYLTITMKKSKPLYMITFIGNIAVI